jgi:hypothetical protein
MRKVGLALLGLLMLLPCATRADDRALLVVAEMIEINAKPADVWNLLKRFNGLKDWHPAFAKSDIIKGRDGQIGAVRALTVKDGPTFTEELLAFNEKAVSFTQHHRCRFCSLARNHDGQAQRKRWFDRSCFCFVRNRATMRKPKRCRRAGSSRRLCRRIAKPEENHGEQVRL